MLADFFVSCGASMHVQQQPSCFNVKIGCSVPLSSSQDSQALSRRVVQFGGLLFSQERKKNLSQGLGMRYTAEAAMAGSGSETGRGYLPSGND